MHIALDTVAPPPINVAAVPMPGHGRMNVKNSQRLAAANFQSFRPMSNFQAIALHVSPKPSNGSIGRAAPPARADAVKRTAPPPMIPKPLTAKRNYITNCDFFNIHLLGSQTCMWRKGEIY